MVKQELEILVRKGLSIRKIAEQTDKSATTIRYWLGKHGLATVGKIPLQPKCKCGERDPLMFYGNKKHACKTCHNHYTRGKAREFKVKAVELMGGGCKVCGFDTFVSALDLHHLDPTKKDPKFTQIRSWSWERQKLEIAKCVLLCSNCHRGVHSGDITL